ncbi:MAG: D-lactate dehydrogenase [Filomicrobium sp.]
MTDRDFINQLKSIVGRKYIHTSASATARFRKGWRSGEGEAEAAVEPGSLVELWRVLKACVDHDRIVIMQAANTGLTEGSAPNGEYDRNVVVINTLRLDKIHILDEGRQIVSHPGGTLFKLEKLLDPYGRQPHSVIGSSCIGASIMGGVCNNSGGALVRRGPVYTELSLFAQKRADGSLVLVNHLGIDLGDEPEAILGRLDRGKISDENILPTENRGSDDGYADRVRDVAADTPARFNADPRTLHEASGCAGKLAVFAVRLDTFPSESGEQVYYVGTNSTGDLTELRRRLLTQMDSLPISAEYLHREIFDIARVYGKDTLLLIHWLGTDALPGIFKLKGQMDGFFGRFSFLPKNLVDRGMQLMMRFVPGALPRRMLQYRDRFEHHLILKVSADQTAQVESILDEVPGRQGWFLCNAAEAKKALLHRFAAAGAAARYGAVHPGKVEDILALDIALRRNDEAWFEELPEEIEKDIVAKLYYGHFLCHVFHQDYAVRKGADPKAVKEKMLALLDQRGAEYPAEHNVGHLYAAKPQLANFYAELDPTNSFNPGIGKTSKQGRPAVAEMPAPTEVQESTEPQNSGSPAA